MHLCILQYKHFVLFSSTPPPVINRFILGMLTTISAQHEPMRRSLNVMTTPSDSEAQNRLRAPGAIYTASVDSVYDLPHRVASTVFGTVYIF